MELDEQLYQDWLLQLQSWAADGRLISAGVDALRLKSVKATDQLNNTGQASLNATYQEIFSSQSFDNTSSSWSYAHHTIQSLQDLNL